jgi:hypothetical protein
MCVSKDSTQKLKRQLPEQGKILQVYTVKELIPREYNEFLQLNNFKKFYLGKEFKQMFLQRRYINDQKACKKMPKEH